MASGNSTPAGAAALAALITFAIVVLYIIAAQWLGDAAASIALPAVAGAAAYLDARKPGADSRRSPGP